VTKLFRYDIPPEIADIIRALFPDLKRSVRAAMDEIAANPECGQQLAGELSGYWKYRVRRFRIIYSVDRPKRTIRIVAIGHRRAVYEELALRLKAARPKKRE
jgi:mRNA interferase RelE/StbE